MKRSLHATTLGLMSCTAIGLLHCGGGAGSTSAAGTTAASTSGTTGVASSSTATTSGSGGSSSSAASTSSTTNASSTSTGSGSGGANGCAPPPVSPIACDDLTNGPASAWSYHDDDDAPTTLSQIAGGPSGAAISANTQSGFGFWLRYDAPSPIDASAAGVLQIAVRAKNVNDWQINSPVIVLEDTTKARRTYSPASQLFPSDGVTWVLVDVPLAGGSGWTATGSAIDLSKVSAIEVGTDTWDAGFQLDIDALAFKPEGAVCKASCPADCGGRGTCDVASLRCVCPVGAVGPDCGTCGEGFVAKNGACALAADGTFDTWPNAVSKANGDPWLAVHHDEIALVQPNLLVLHFVNKSDPAKATIVNDVIAGFADGSRHHAYGDPSAKSELAYRIAKTVDLRDGVNGRAPAPSTWTFENSTLYPRKGAPGSLALDYAALYSPSFAALYGFPDPNKPGSFLDLCTLVEQGVVNEVWIVGSGDVAGDATGAEVLEMKQRYTPDGNKIPGSFEPCAGNGCFTADVPACKRSVRIGWVNYNRGPGCYMHSQGHGLESAASHRTVPALSAWFLPFAAFDLDTRGDLPFSSFYGIGCATPPCIAYPSPTKATFLVNGHTLARDPFDGVCGSVHFPPNGRQDYDYAGPDTVLSSCEGFGESAVACGIDQKTNVTSALWAGYEALHGDCGGGFLTWWYQSMPSHASGQRFADGRSMKSVWPFLFY